MKFLKYNLDFRKTNIMGVLNITPDSFSDGGDFVSFKKALIHAKQMVQDGADIIDIGGESSRPNATLVSEEEELKRVLPIIKRLSKVIHVPISIDTQKPRVAEACIKAGAAMINDIGGLRNPEMIKVAVMNKVPVIIMHMQGTPQTMQKYPKYKDIISDISIFFENQITIAKAAGIKNIILDPGIGFGKTVEHNLEILRRLKEFSKFGFPIMVGPSRKSFIGKINKSNDPKDRLEGTIASISVAIMNGANIVRVHDVRECRKAVEIIDAII